MKVKIINECGYDEAALGFSLSYNSNPERSKELFPIYAHKDTGENKFLESIAVWLDIDAPIFFWSEFDTYRVGVTKQSESTMHTLAKRSLSQSDFEFRIDENYLLELNQEISIGGIPIEKIKNDLPTGFLQRRIVTTNYKTLRHIYSQRHNHRLPHWKYFCGELLKQLEHPEFIKKS